MGGIGAIIAAGFGIFWIVITASTGAPSFFPCFGFVFIAVAVLSGIYHFYNASSRNRMSTFDVTTGEEESDPIAEALDLSRGEEEKEGISHGEGPREIEGDFCPYCGTRVEADFDFCPKCGKDI
jgi:hypothetical protein